MTGSTFATDGYRSRFIRKPFRAHTAMTHDLRKSAIRTSPTIGDRTLRRGRGHWSDRHANGGRGLVTSRRALPATAAIDAETSRERRRQA
ncbi:hypothetical protein ACFSC3_00890 [Sphingomonas floccifaciens]|uniref:Uncharacterized protein n=1 Tax=Sphingomonas floccifaciens TaxID=1844115 RepID=A0ABW4N7J9_9SPHN